MRDVMDDNIWKETPSKQIGAHSVNCKTLVDVISHILGATKAQKALGYAPVGSPGEVDNIDDVEIWLRSLTSLPRDEECVQTFVRMFLQPFLTLAAGQCAEASAMFRALCAECKAQKFGASAPTPSINYCVSCQKNTQPDRWWFGSSTSCWITKRL